ncbi:MAG: hypothetical protein R3E68_16645 [Burkholderiaceae bacterium]
MRPYCKHAAHAAPLELHVLQLAAVQPASEFTVPTVQVSDTLHN